MKIFLLSLSVIAFNEMLGQVINPEFDDWVVIQIGQPYENPVGWTTNNETTKSGLASTPITKGVDSIGCFARIASNAHGIDATLSGVLSQTISAVNLIEIEFDSKCDTLIMAGKCIVRVLDQSKSIVLFEDTSYTVSHEFSRSTINIASNWTTENDSITIQFIAKGGFDEWDEEEDGYSVFMIDKVSAEYITSTVENGQDLGMVIYPNPASDVIHILLNQAGAHPQISISTLMGQPILRTEFTDWLEVDWIPNGTYILSSISKNHIQSRILIIHR